MNKKNIAVLDCTLRDGGLGLEDAMLNTGNCDVFKDKSVAGFIETMKASSIDIIELGAIEITNSNRSGFSIYQNIEQVSKLIPENKPDNQMYVALFRGPDTPIENIPEWNPLYCEGIRVIIRYSEMNKSLNFCRALAEKGYKVFVQPMLTMRYNDSELQTLIDESNDLEAYALYLVDSYGYMESHDVLKLFRRFDEGLSDRIRIGFHAHNNMNLAFSNVRTLVEQNSNRSIIVDSTIMGMGQGAGNMQTELLIPYLNNKNTSNYDYYAVLEACEIIEAYWKDNLWGYSVMNLLPAINKTAYKFSSSLRKKHKLPYAQIHKILSNIPEELRHRYTSENTNKLLKMFNIRYNEVKLQ
jgi:4-hydroxy 2-oxovalerate aldolase